MLLQPTFTEVSCIFIFGRNASGIKVPDTVLRWIERDLRDNVRTITKDSATGLDTGQDDYNKGICSLGSLVNNPVR